jgi:hypothetical protein
VAAAAAAIKAKEEWTMFARSEQGRVGPRRPGRSILGSFRFDANGDTTQPLISVFRITRGQPRLLTAITAPTSTKR